MAETVLLKEIKGFTVIETLIVVIILALLVVSIMPSVRNYFNQSRLKGAAENLYDDITLARTNAIAMGSTVQITFSTGASWCYGISSSGIGCSCALAASATNCNLGIRSSNSYTGTTLATTIGGASTTFSAARGIPNNTGTITLSTTGGSESLVLTLSALGTSTLCSPSGTVGGYVAC